MKNFLNVILYIQCISNLDLQFRSSVDLHNCLSEQKSALSLMIWMILVCFREYFTKHMYPLS